MMPAKAEAPPSTVFVLEIDGQPILAFRPRRFVRPETRQGGLAARGLEANDDRAQAALGWEVAD